MAKITTEKKERLISALTLWRSYKVEGALNTEYLETRVDESTGLHYTLLTFDGREAADGRVRIFAYYARPEGEKQCPAILLFRDAKKPFDAQLMSFFVSKGYAVLMPDYEGVKTVQNVWEVLEEEESQETTTAPKETFEWQTKEDCTKADEETFFVADSKESEEKTTRREPQTIPNRERTIYPPSLEYANYDRAKGLYDVEDVEADETCWYEWTYLGLYAIEFLKSLEDVGKIGVIGIRLGGEIAWKVMLSSDVACGIPINAAGWLSSKEEGKFTELSSINLTGERHRYIAAIDSQSYAAFVKCPVLMVCSLGDEEFDADRAYDTYMRIGGENSEGNAIVYSSRKGSCISRNGIYDIDVFLEKYLKGREVFIPSSLNVTVREEEGILHVEATGDPEAIVEEMGICYAEAALVTRSAHRDWNLVSSQTGAEIKDGKIECEIRPYEGAQMGLVYAYARYLNGFEIVSKIVAKRLQPSKNIPLGDRMLYAGGESDGFCVAHPSRCSIGEIFLKQEGKPKLVEGYGGIKGLYSVGGLKLKRIAAPRFVAPPDAMLKFDVYSVGTETLTLTVEKFLDGGRTERYCHEIPVKGGGKWKRILLSARDFKNDLYGRPLSAFSDAVSLSFDFENEENLYAITNILWL